MLVRVKNSLTDIATNSFIGTAVSSGGTVVNVKNSNSFSDDWAIQVGNTGEEESEVKLISTVSGLNLNLTSTLTFNHPVDTPVYAIKYNQVVFKVSTAGTAGTATAITNGTVTIQPDQPFTQFDHTTAANGYAYKACFRNSATGDLTSDSDWLTTTGYSFYSRAKIRERIKNKLFDASFIKNDAVFDDWINEWLELMNNAAINVNKDYSLGTVNVAFGSDGLGTVTATDFKDFRKIEITTDGGVTYYNATRASQTDFNAQDVYPNTSPIWYPYGDTVFGVKPDGVAGTARISYYTHFTPLDSDGDELPNVFRPYSKSFVDYGLAQAYGVDNKLNEKASSLQDAIAQRDLFIRQITPRSMTGPKEIKIVDETDPNSDGYAI